MPRIPEVKDSEATPEVKEMFEQAAAQMGSVPNVFRAMGQSPTVLRTFMHMQQTLSTGMLDRQFQQQIAVPVAQFDRSSYCLAVNTAVGLHTGLSAPGSPHRS